MKNSLRSKALPPYRLTALPQIKEKSLTLHKFFLFLIFAGFALFTSCEKETALDSSSLAQAQNEEEVYVKNGTLHFKSWEAFEKKSLEIANLPEPEYYAWIKSLDFESLRSWVRKANEELDELNTQIEFDQWLTKYEDIMEIQEDDIRPISQDYFAMDFANREGMYYIEDAIVKILPDKRVTILDGDLTKLPQAKEMRKTDLENGILIDFTDKFEIELRSGCPDQEVDRSNAADDRKVIYTAEINTGSQAGGMYTYTLVTIREKGKKRNIFKNYKDWPMKLKWMNCTWQIIDNHNVAHTQPEHVRHSDEQKVYEIYTTWNLNDVTLTQNYTKPSFNYIKGRATSDLLDWNKYAVMCCGLPSGECPSPGVP